jgi:hypothetical protein
VSRLSRECGILNISQPYRPPRPVTGIDLLYSFFTITLTICLHMLDILFPTYWRSSNWSTRILTEPFSATCYCEKFSSSRSPHRSLFWEFISVQFVDRLICKQFWCTKIQGLQQQLKCDVTNAGTCLDRFIRGTPPANSLSLCCHSCRFIHLRVLVTKMLHFETLNIYYGHFVLVALCWCSDMSSCSAELKKNTLVPETVVWTLSESTDVR